MENLGHFRKSYEKNQLLESELPEDPITLFARWFADCQALEPETEPNAMTLSTIDPDGFPKSRVVLLKSFGADGFIFFTNYLSEKGQAIDQHPKVCLSFFWAASQRQIIIQGGVTKIGTDESNAYFESRPYGSKLGAWASAQSQVVESREALDKRLEEFARMYPEHVPRPPHWGGYVVHPFKIEFWQGRANRMHDRIRYFIHEQGWHFERLSP